MQDVLIALFVGLMLGWLVEWLIDWRYWRPTVAALRQENEHLRRLLETTSASEKPQRTSPTAAEGK